ncbi:MAG: nucleoside deaminase [Chlorobi bacterium]|nr:nucleoside deaminase [Chlorobiota bacterium]
MLFEEDKYRFMHAALKEAEKAFEKDEVPIGAVVVHNGKIIGRGHNQTESLNDATAHAEMIAITSASATLGSKFLDECEIFITAEPCLMCSGAIILSRISKIYFGTFEPKFGAAGSVYDVFGNKNGLEIYSGLMADESRNLLHAFFSKMR